MKKQPREKIRSWEKLTANLLQLYAQEMIVLCKESEYTAPEVSVESEQQRAKIRFDIIEIGKMLDETERNYNNLIEEYGKEEV